jgi:hypothetical protein
MYSNYFISSHYAASQILMEFAFCYHYFYQNQSINVKIKLIFHFGSSSGVSIVLFSAEWAEQCLQILNVMTELSKQDDFKVFQFLNVPAEDFSEVSLKHQVNKKKKARYFSLPNNNCCPLFLGRSCAHSNIFPQ